MFCDFDRNQIPLSFQAKHHIRLTTTKRLEIILVMLLEQTVETKILRKASLDSRMMKSAALAKYPCIKNTGPRRGRFDVTLVLIL